LRPTCSSPSARCWSTSGPSGAVPARIAPILEEVAKEYDGKILIAKMDVDANQAVPAKFGIRGIPTLILFKNGVAAAQKVGAMAKGQLTLSSTAISK
jgi:thioredoxin-like negative regulator of GroEL